jgi:hypothetical protein
MQSKPIFSSSVGTIVMRLALPQRSPYPLTVPCTSRAPARTATSVFATPQPVSSWVWIPTPTLSPSSATTRAVASSTCEGTDDPLVSHSVTFSAPASAAARRQRSV